MDSTLEVSKFDTADANELLTLWSEVLPSQQPHNAPLRALCRKLTSKDDLVFTGRLEGRVVAAVMAGYDGVRGWIYALAVHQTFRKRGLGRAMLQAAEIELQQRGCEKLNLQVHGDNVEVTDFYHRCGYQTEDRVSMGKPLLGKTAANVPTLPVNQTVSLSQITGQDKAAYLKHLNATDEFKANMLMMPYPYRDIDAEVWLSQVRNQSVAADQSCNWAIRNQEGELIGGVGLAGIAENEKAELGYWLAKPYWGQGITTAVARTVCGYAFDKLNLQRIFARVVADNQRSLRVLEKAGFHQEGMLRAHEFVHGAAKDIVYLGRLNLEA